MPPELRQKLEGFKDNQSMEGERRLVTLLFCDVVGSTAKAEKFDPEEWTEIINGAYEYMIKPVFRFEGTMVHLSGDALLALFGAPLAHEDDPQRAILAGLNIIDGIKAYQEEAKKHWGIDFSVRVGIHTGTVVVGGMGSDMHLEYTASGDAANLAARMQQSAQPMTIQVSESTYRLVSNFFEFEDLGTLELKGKEKPVQTYRVIRAINSGESSQLRVTPFVGREREMNFLVEAMKRLQRGIGGIIALVGEAGIGKTRLVREGKRFFLTEASQEHFWIGTSSQSYESNLPYKVIQNMAGLIVGLNKKSANKQYSEGFYDYLESLTPERRYNLELALDTLFGTTTSLEGENFKNEIYLAVNDLMRFLVWSIARSPGFR